MDTLPAQETGPLIRGWIYGIRGAMTVAEIQAQIVAVDASISAVLTGQQYSIDTGHGRQSVTRASLSELRRYRADLDRMLTRASNGYVESAEVHR